MKSLRSTPVKSRSVSAKTRVAKVLGAKDPLAGLLGQLKRGRARVPVARKGLPPAVLISMGEFARLRAIDESPHAEIIGRLLFAR
jgi:hypothetical protein